MVATRSRAAATLSVLLNPVQDETKPTVARALLTPANVEPTRTLVAAPALQSVSASQRHTTGVGVAIAPAERTLSTKRPRDSSGQQRPPRKQARIGEQENPEKHEDQLRTGICEEERQSALLLRAASTRLVWSRVAEVKALKRSLEDLGRAISHVETIRSRLETAADRDLASVLQIAATRTPRASTQQNDCTFQEYFQSLINHLVSNDAEIEMK